MQKIFKTKKKQKKEINLYFYVETIKNKDYAFFDTIQLLFELQINIFHDK